MSNELKPGDHVEVHLHEHTVVLFGVVERVEDERVLVRRMLGGSEQWHPRETVRQVPPPPST